MSSGLMSGEKTRSAFNADKHGIGARVGGEIVEPFPFQVQQRDFNDSDILLWWDAQQTQPKMQIVVTVQTDLDEGPDEDGNPDNGLRRHYIKGGDLQRRAQDAVRKAGGKDFEIGADFYVTRTGQGEAIKKGGPKPWLHKVEYTRPTGSSGLNTSKAKSAPVNDDEPPF